MNLLPKIINSLWQQDYVTLSHPRVVLIIYCIIFTILFLENGLLPASFLPGDSLLLLSGVMIAKGIINFFPTLIILSIAAALGCWFSYIQGRCLGDTKIVKNWLLKLPSQYKKWTYTIFNRYGLTALLVGRFLALVRTFLPIIAGIAGLNNAKFQLFNWLSALIWVSVLILLGYTISTVPIIKYHEDYILTIFIVIQIFLFVIGLLSSLILIICRLISKIMIK